MPVLANMNALDTSANIIFQDVVKNDYTVKTSLLSDKINELSKEKRETVYDVIDVMISHFN